MGVGDVNCIIFRNSADCSFKMSHTHTQSHLKSNWEAGIQAGTGHTSITADRDKPLTAPVNPVWMFPDGDFMIFTFQWDYQPKEEGWVRTGVLIFMDWLCEGHFVEHPERMVWNLELC